MINRANQTWPDTVHIDTDNDQWGRLACDAAVVEVRRHELVVTTTDHRRATITVPKSDVSILESDMERARR